MANVIMSDEEAYKMGKEMLNSAKKVGLKVRPKAKKKLQHRRVLHG